MTATTQRTGLIILSMALGLLMSSLDNTIVSASINHVIEDIRGFDKLSWIFTAYMLAATSTMLVFGKMSDLFGRKLFYLIGISMFLLGSALCGVAQSIDQLIWFRVIQGIGSGAIFPISFTIIYTVFADPKQAAKMSGVFGAIFGLSSVAGPQLGTFITEHWGWRWCFYVNVPIGVASFIILLIALKESRSDTKPKVDYWGTILLVITTVSIMLALELGGKDYAWSSLEIIGLFASAVIFGSLFVWVELRAEEPILPFTIFKNKMVLGTSIICFCQGALMFSAITYLPIFSVAVLGHENSNSILTPMMGSVVAGAIVAGFLQSKFAFRTLMTISMTIAVCTAILLSMLTIDTPQWYMITLMVMLGLGAIGPMMSVAQNSIASSVAPKYIGVSSSIVGFWRSMGGVLGASIMATIVNHEVKQQVADGAAALNIPADQVDTLANPELLVHAAGTITPEIRDFLRSVLGTAVDHGFILSICAAIIALITATLVGAGRLSANKEKQNPTHAA